MYYGRGVVRGMASALVLLLLGGGAGAQRPTQKAWFRNIELCNGVDRTVPDIQIGGCTALIDSGKGTPQTLAMPTTTVVTPIRQRANTTAPSRTTISRSNSIPTTPRPSTTAA